MNNFGISLGSESLTAIVICGTLFIVGAVWTPFHNVELVECKINNGEVVALETGEIYCIWKQTKARPISEAG